MQHETNSVSTMRRVATEGKRWHQVPKVHHRWGIQCLCLCLFSDKGFWSFPPSHPFHFPASCLELRHRWGSPSGKPAALPSYL